MHNSTESLIQSRHFEQITHPGFQGPFVGGRRKSRFNEFKDYIIVDNAEASGNKGSMPTECRVELSWINAISSSLGIWLSWGVASGRRVLRAR